MKKAFIRFINVLFAFLFKVLGFEALADRIESKVTNYRLRLNIVPVSYKLFLVLLGVSLGVSGFLVFRHYSVLSFVSIGGEYVNEAKAPIVVEVEKIVERDEVGELADLIWSRESSRGVNNYSKCEAIGKFNGIGFGIPGDGSYMCFDSHEDEMTVLRGWIITRKAWGWSELKMKCTYSGNNYEEC